MIKGALRIHGIQPIRERREITKDIILKMLATINTSTLDNLNIYASFCVAFAGFCRPSEITWEQWDSQSPLTHVTRNSIQFTPAGVAMHLPKSKTDQYRKGTTLTLSPASDPSCPVLALKRLFKAQPKSGSDPLFSRLFSVFNKRWFAQHITETLLSAGIDPSKYSGHSFHRGAANTAITAGGPPSNGKTYGTMAIKRCR